MKVKYRPCGCRVYQTEERGLSRNRTPPPGTPLPSRPICRPKARTTDDMKSSILQCFHPEILKEEPCEEAKHILSLTKDDFFDLWKKCHKENYPAVLPTEWLVNSEDIAEDKSEDVAANSENVNDLEQIENQDEVQNSQENAAKCDKSSPILENIKPEDKTKPLVSAVYKSSSESPKTVEARSKTKSLVSAEYESSGESHKTVEARRKLDSTESKKKENCVSPQKCKSPRERRHSSSSEHCPSHHSRKSRSRSPLIRKFKSIRSHQPRSRSPSCSRSNSSYRSRTPESCFTEEKFRVDNIDEKIYENLGSGVYYCKCCSATMNSDATWITHLNGKRHAKNLRQENLHKIAVSTVSSQVHTRYPPPAVGMRRIKANDISRIQCIIDELPFCPGLDDVIEIQSSEREINYYCELCDAPCSAVTILPHLTGIKHQLRCLKRIDPSFYYKIENDATSKRNKLKMQALLSNDERKHGRGRLRVEKDVPIENFSPQPGCSSWNSSLKEEPMVISQMGGASEILPDTSKSDFYCSTCDSHMNNNIMWEAHIRGKRHRKNLNRCPGEKPSGVKYFPSSYTKPKLLKYLRDVNAPVVGLDYIRETQNPEAGETYNCFLCGACCTTDIVDHILTTKHRIKYLKMINSQTVDGILQLELAPSTRANLIEDECRIAEQKLGRGKVEVYVRTV